LILSNGKWYQPGGYDYAVDQETGQPISISRTTGEVIPAVTETFPIGTQHITPDQQEAARKRNEQLQDFFEQKARLDSFGPFSFVCASQQFEDISPDTAARLVYLSAFLKWGAGELLLTQRNQMNRDNLPEVMGLSRWTVNRFLEEVVPKYISLDDAGNLYMNPECFFRGKIGRHGESASWRKIYVDSVKKLYRMAGKTKHRYLGYVFQMLPFISIQYNGLCSNIFQKDLSMVRYLSDKDFCEKIGYDYSAVSRLRKTYKAIRFDVEDHTEPFCAFVDAGERTKIYVNPHILYNGTRPDIVAILGSFCKDT